MEVFGLRLFQAEGTASARVLGQECLAHPIFTVPTTFLIILYVRPPKWGTSTPGLTSTCQ